MSSSSFVHGRLMATCAEARSRVKTNASKKRATRRSKVHLGKAMEGEGAPASPWGKSDQSGRHPRAGTPSSRPSARGLRPHRTAAVAEGLLPAAAPLASRTAAARSARTGGRGHPGPTRAAAVPRRRRRPRTSPSRPPAARSARRLSSRRTSSGVTSNGGSHPLARAAAAARAPSTTHRGGQATATAQTPDAGGNHNRQRGQVLRAVCCFAECWLSRGSGASADRYPRSFQAFHPSAVRWLAALGPGSAARREDAEEGYATKAPPRPMRPRTTPRA